MAVRWQGVKPVTVQVADQLGELFYDTLLAEVSTIDRSGTPIITPMQHAWMAERQNFILSSALGVRYKLDRIYRTRRSRSPSPTSPAAG